MINLIKADLKRATKDKSLRVALLLSVILAILVVGLYWLMNRAISSFPDLFEAEEAANLKLYARSLFSGVFNISSDFGFALPIFLAVFIGREFSYGTIRNKVILGYSRDKIYFSSLISSICVGLILLLFNIVVVTSLGTLVLGWGKEINAMEIGWIFKTLGLGILIYLIVISLTNFLVMNTKSIMISIVSIISIIFIGTIIVSIIENVESIKKIADYIFLTHAGWISNSGVDTTITLSMTLKIIISNVLLFILINIGGSQIFKHLDLK